MKLNNKGFAISSIMYIILVLAVILIVITLSLLSSRKLILDKLKDEVIDNIKYSEILSTLKKEAIMYATENSIEKESIKIEDINSTISSDVLEENNLYDKYLTMINNSGSYDVYLGSEKTLQGNDLYAKNIIDVINYKIGGNSVQSGELNPDTPQEIQSVGDKANLFNFDMVTGQTSVAPDYDNKSFLLSATNNLYIIGQSFSGVSTAFEEFNKVLNITDIGYYCLKVKVTCDEENITPRSDWIMNVTGDGAISPIVVEQTQKDGYLFVKYQITEEILESLKTKAETFRLYMYAFRKSESQENVDATISEITFLKGNYTIDTMPEYEEYGKYRIPIKLSGKNLIDYTKAAPRTSPQSVIIDKENNGVVWSGDYFFQIPVNIESGKKIFLTLESAYSHAWALKYEDGSNTTTYTIDKPITAEQNVKYIYIYKSSPATSESNMVFKNIMLKYDEEAEYEPYIEPVITNIYLDEPLRGIQDKYDTIEYANKKLDTKIKEISFSGEESWSKYASVDNHYQITVGDNYFKQNGDNYVLSNYFEIKEISNNYYSRNDYAVMSVDGSRIRFKNKDIADLDSWVQFVKSKKESGIPLTVIYALAQNIEKTITLPRIGVNPNASVLSIDTKVAPTNVEFTVIEKIKKL